MADGGGDRGPAPAPSPVPARTLRRPLWRLVLDLLVVVGLYYVVPLGESDPVRLGVRLAVFAVGFVLVAWSIGRQVARLVQAGSAERRLDGLLVTVVVGVVLSAAADYAVAMADPTQFVGLETRTDALYFAVVTLMTVGFGDVHAQGQVARTLVICQMVFNAAVIATAAGVLARSVGERMRAGTGPRRRDGGDRA